MLHHSDFNKQSAENRPRVLAVVFLLLALWIIARLFMLQIIQRDYYALFALNTHEIYEKLYPKRGAIYWQDARTREEYPAAINKEYYLIYAVPRDIPPADLASSTIKLTEIFGLTDENQKKNLADKLSNATSVYALLLRKADSKITEQIDAARLTGINYTSEIYRYYPEKELAGNVLGFVGFNDKGAPAGQYGLEGYWQDKIAGKGGWLTGEKGALGGWISLAGRKAIQPENGPNLVLTLDRALEFKACKRLKEGMDEYGAKSGSLVLMNPKTGAILAMCSLPDFDPNNYSKVKNISAFNNSTIFTPYEPGSVFKPFTMAAALDLNLINPTTVYVDPCQRVINGYTIKNAEQKCYGQQTMTEVLEKSINTGVVWVEEKLGNERFSDYVKKFGFGQKTGIAVNIESPGDVSSLDKRGQIFGASGSFGQGLTVTPLQLAAAFSAIANEGRLPRPYIVQEVRYVNGKKDVTQPEIIETVMSPRAAKLLSGMLTSVVENHYSAAKIPGFFVAGKTGTAQIPERGRYSADRTNHTFAGFAPADDPQFVLVVKYEEPNRKWAEQTALPVFKDVLKFALDYFNLVGKR